MTDLLSLLALLRRPALLMKTARLGAQSYHRSRHLRRVLKGAVPASHGAALVQLMALEDAQNDKRKNGDANYAPALHVDIMIALISEAYLLSVTPPPSRPSHMNASGSAAFLAATNSSSLATIAGSSGGAT